MILYGANKPKNLCYGNTQLDALKLGNSNVTSLNGISGSSTLQDSSVISGFKYIESNSTSKVTDRMSAFEYVPSDALALKTSSGTGTIKTKFACTMFVFSWERFDTVSVDLSFKTYDTNTTVIRVNMTGGYFKIYNSAGTEVSSTWIGGNHGMMVVKRKNGYYIGSSESDWSFSGATTVPATFDKPVYAVLTSSTNSYVYIHTFTKLDYLRQINS